MPPKETTATTLLIIGANGQIGFELARHLAPMGEVVALGRNDCDLGDVDAIRRVLRHFRPGVVFNAAGYTAVDAAEHDEEQAIRINATAVGVMAEEARALGALLVHYSSDYVFDGTLRRPYVEGDAVHPLSAYGRSKAAGETLVAAAGGAWLVLRTSWVAGVHGKNFAKTMLRLATTEDTVRVVNDQHGAPTTAALVAEVTARIVAQHWLHANERRIASGIYHLASRGSTTWHGYAVRVLELAQALGMSLRVSPSHIQAVSSAEFGARAARPERAVLDTRRLRETFGVELPAWQDEIASLVKKLIPARLPGVPAPVAGGVGGMQ